MVWSFFRRRSYALNEVVRVCAIAAVMMEALCERENGVDGSRASLLGWKKVLKAARRCWMFFLTSWRRKKRGGFVHGGFVAISVQ